MNFHIGPSGNAANIAREESSPARDAKIAALERKILRLTHALANIDTLIDGKEDTVDGDEGRPEPNVFMSIRSEIDEALR